MPIPDFLDFGAEKSAGVGSTDDERTPSVPGSLAAGRCIVLYVASDGVPATLQAANGWTLARDPLGNAAAVGIAGQCAMAIYWKRATGATETMPVISDPAIDGNTCIAFHANVYRDVRATGTPFHRIVVATVPAATATIAPPSLASTIDACMFGAVAASASADSTFNSWGGVGLASPNPSLDSGWFATEGNDCAWAGGRGGKATAGSGTLSSTFGAATQQAQISFALASLSENEAFAAVEGALQGTISDALASVAASAVSSSIGAGSTPSIAAQTLPSRDGLVASALEGSLATIAAVATFGPVGSVVAALEGSSGGFGGSVPATATLASRLAGSAVSATGSAPLVATAQGQSEGSSPGTAATHAVPLTIGAAAVRQRRNALGPSTGVLETLPAYPAWQALTAYSLEDGDRVTRGNRIYECSSSGTSGTTGPAGTGIGIVDGGARWNYLGEGTGAVGTRVSGSVILYSAARGKWAQEPAPPIDNLGNAPTLLDGVNFYDPPFQNSANALYATIGASGGPGHTVGLAWADSDEVTVTLVEVTAGAHVQDVSFAKRSPIANVVTSAPVTTTARAVLIGFAWLNGPVRTPGTRHKAVPQGGAALIPEATALLALSGNGYIQLATLYREVEEPGEHTLAIETDEGEGAAFYVAAIQAAEGRVGSVVGRLTGSSASGAAAATDAAAAAVSAALAGSTGDATAAAATSVALSASLRGSEATSNARAGVIATTVARAGDSLGRGDAAAALSGASSGTAAGTAPAATGHAAATGTGNGSSAESVASILGFTGSVVAATVVWQLEGSSVSGRLAAAPRRPPLRRIGARGRVRRA